MRAAVSGGLHVSAIFRNLRGALVVAGFTVNTIFWFVPIFLLAIVKLLLPIAGPRRFVTRIIMKLGEYWISVNTANLTVGASIDWEARGTENLRPDAWYLVMANHQTWVDILVLQKVFNRRIPFLKFFIKQQLIWFPVLGIAWWAMDMPFMKRYSNFSRRRVPPARSSDIRRPR